MGRRPVFLLDVVMYCIIRPRLCVLCVFCVCSLCGMVQVQDHDHVGVGSPSPFERGPLHHTAVAVARLFRAPPPSPVGLFLCCCLSLAALYFYLVAPLVP